MAGLVEKRRKKMFLTDKNRRDGYNLLNVASLTEFVARGGNTKKTNKKEVAIQNIDQ